MGFENSYSFIDRVTHKIAFHTYRNIQIVLSDLEDSVYEKKFSLLDIKKPVFITALPRAGTTLLLEVIMNSGEFATHSYRNMPFLLTPLFWDRFSSGFQVNNAKRERAHGDGMLVNTDSYEAFEEILWKIFYTQHYKSKCISPWGDEVDSEFVDFFTTHIKKLILLRSKGESKQIRYMSKNNLNIARIESLLQVFPDAVILVPFRDPIQHSASLLRQHNNFNKMHEKDVFARQYMAAVGHFDFGKNLKPVDFDNWMSSAHYRDPLQAGFWLEYWTAAYSYLLKYSGKSIHFLSFETVCGKPASGLDTLSEILALKICSSFTGNASRLKTVKPHAIDTNEIEMSLLSDAAKVYEQLKAISVN